MASGTIAIAAGILLAGYLPTLPPLSAATACGALLLLLSLRWQLLRWPALLALGLLWGCYHGHQLSARLLPPALERQPVWLEGRVSGLPQTLASGNDGGGRVVQRFDLQVSRSGCAQKQAGACDLALRRVRLSWYGGEPPKVGEHWRFQVKLRRPRGFANPAGFDYGRWLVSRGYHATGYISASGAEGAVPAQRLAPAPWWRGQRQQLQQYLQQRLQPLPRSEFLLALLVGDKSGIDREQWRNYNATGTTHLLAISGLHIGIVAGLAAAIGALLARLLSLWRGPVMRLVMLLPTGCGALAATGYAYLAGFALPTQRALIMTLVALLAFTLRRRSSPWPFLGLALLGVLLLDPLAGHSAGFWLSFAAVAVLLYALGGRRRRSVGVGERVGAGSWRAQWAVFIGLLPVLVVTLGQLSLTSLPANLLAIPLYSLAVVPLNLLALLVDAASPAAPDALWQLADTLLGVAQRYCQWLAALPWGSLALPPPAPWALALALLGSLLWLAPRAVPGRALAPALMAPLLLPAASAPQPGTGELLLSVLDVGQGLAVVVETEQHSLVYDLGPGFNDRFDTATAVVLPYLQSRRIRRLDRLLISHGDGDHAGGAERFAAEIAITDTLVGEAVAGLDGYRACVAGQRWSWDGVEFELLHPQREQAKGNNRSCVLQIRSGGQRVLLSGDIERSVERALLPSLAPVAVLVAPHHGSTSSSGTPFVRRLHPQHTVFSAGYKHHFGHPRAEVVARYARVGSRLWNTAEHGALQFLVSPAGTRALAPWRARRHYYWEVESASGEAASELAHIAQSASDTP